MINIDYHTGSAGPRQASRYPGLLGPYGRRGAVYMQKPSYEELERRVRDLEKEASGRRKAEAALRESEVRLKTVLDTIQAGIVVIDPETHIIVGVNAAAACMLGASRQEILNTVCHKCICAAENGQCPITDLGEHFDNAEQVLLTAKGERIPILKTVVSVTLAGRKHLLESFLDITERKRAEEERERLIEELQEALAKVKTLSGLLPICASCKRIRDDRGYWQQIEAYIQEHSDAEFSHSVCPECARKLYPEIFQDE
jgi:PAS domain S-box-containing protein